MTVRYLESLISSRLLYKDCKILVKKLESRINDWRNKFLSIAGRLQLIRSVLSSMHIYWAFVFILSARIIHDLEQLMRGFLWCQGELKKGKAKVAWESVCKPKLKGGLGIRRLEDFNVSLMATHIWSILSHKESLWVKWIHSYKLKGRSLWDVPCLGDRWPPDWLDRVLNLSSIPALNLIVDCDDVRLWRDLQGNLKPFSVAYAWDSVRLRADVVDWYHVVWFPQCILRHAFHMWLVAKQKLKTQDRLRQWDVWFQVRGLAGMDQILPWFADISTYLILTSKGKSVVSIISWLLLGVVAYYIWMERNLKLFKKKASTIPQIVQVISSTVRLKLVTFKFKKVSTHSRLLLDQWNIQSCCMVHEGSSGQPYLGRLLPLCYCWRARRVDVAVFKVPLARSLSFVCLWPVIHTSLSSFLLEVNVVLQSHSIYTKDGLPEVADPDAVIEEVTGGSIYWEPHIHGIPIPVEGTYFDTLDEAIDMYTNYAEMGGFEIKKSGQRKTKSGVVKHKYIMCNKEGVPKGDCLFLFSKDEVKLAAYLEKLKLIKEEVKADMPNPPSRNT
ncbi:homeodomain-like protein [Tanacetum coccineum]